MFRSFYSFILVTLATAGCFGNGPDMELDAVNGQPIELETFAEHAALVTCTRMVECCTDAEITSHFNESGLVRFDSMEECVAVYQDLTEAFALPALRASIERGYLAYDAAVMGRCCEEFSETSCVDLDLIERLERDDQCPGAFIPMQDTGDPCVGDRDCIIGSCGGGGADDEGVCTPLPQAGEACTFECAEPLRCGREPGLEARCLPRLPVAATCSVDDDCESRQCVGELGAATCRDESLCQGL